METPLTSPPWVAENKHTRMIDVGEKRETARRAQACGSIKMGNEAFNAVLNKTNPKGDVLAIAEVAGIEAAKRTSDIIPLCHPILIESIEVKCHIDKSISGITVTCEVSTHGKTGVEMEALSGVNGALLAIYDLSKIIDPAITISDVKLLWKEGGKNGRWESKGYKPITQSNHLLYENIKVVVITLSDRVSKGEYEDLSGPELVRFLSEKGAKEVTHKQIPDDPNQLKSILEDARLNYNKIDLILTTGGTGVGPRDNTPETISSIADREIPGIGELLRSHGSRFNNMSWASRSSAWILGRTLVVALPGNRNAVLEGCQVLEHLIPHLVKVISGSGHE